MLVAGFSTSPKARSVNRAGKRRGPEPSGAFDEHLAAIDGGRQNNVDSACDASYHAGATRLNGYGALPAIEVRSEILKVPVVAALARIRTVQTAFDTRSSLDKLKVFQQNSGPETNFAITISEE